MRVWILLALLCSARSALKGDERTQQLAATLSQQADAFRKIAPDLVGQETLFQRAMKPKGGFHIRVGANAQKSPQPVWQERRILSEYSFAAFAREGGALHELRRVTAVDGRTVQDSKKAQEELAAIVTAPDDKRKKELLVQFEKYGLVGAVTDFGQLLLLFNSNEILHYEFTYRRTEMQGIARILVFGYQQIDGPEGLTVITSQRDAAHDAAHNEAAAQTMRIRGEVWVRENTFIPVRLTLATEQGQVREEASVDYSMSSFGALLPFWTEHRELRGGKVVVENKFSYADFHKFDASSQINFHSVAK
ncbi:MAG: hypothetical protein ACXVZT_07425 [Terriglobales bacterium]